jgi:adenylylsulfate kinase
MAQREQPAFAVWITGLPASGKSTVAAQLSRQLGDRGIDVEVLESDELRKIFSTQPRYDEQDREYFYRSMAFIGRVLTDHGIAVIFDATANLRRYRDQARQQISQFIEVYIDSPLETCIQRDPKGIYLKGRKGEATSVPGLQAPYEPPQLPDVIIHGDRDNPTEAAGRIVQTLISKGLVSPPGHACDKRGPQRARRTR